MRVLLTLLCLVLIVGVVSGQSTAPPEAPTNVQVTPSHLQISGITGDAVVLSWYEADCPGMSYTMAMKAGTRSLTVTCYP